MISTDLFLGSVFISVGELARRYAVLLMDMARRAGNCLRCQKCAQEFRENPPSSFHEALQSLWITFVLFHSTMEFCRLDAPTNISTHTTDAILIIMSSQRNKPIAIWQLACKIASGYSLIRNNRKYGPDRTGYNIMEQIPKG